MCNDTYVALGGGPVDAAAEAIVGSRYVVFRGCGGVGVAA